MSGILIFVILISFICYCYGKHYVGDFGHASNKKKTSHIQMVEENF